jgi:DNA modification methylase
MPSLEKSFLYRGDATWVLPRLAQRLSDRGIPKAKLLLTSPPYLKITNYHYDQWIRLWMLGGAPSDRLLDSPFHGENRGKFANEDKYRKLLLDVFSLCKSMCSEKATIYVRTDWREPTRSITRTVLERVFPRHDLRQKAFPVRGETQTGLFGHYAPRFGEVDLILTR